jgi:hypothetical protein
VRDPITALERAIHSLPADTRAAMLEGIQEHPIVCGAYTDGRGGICPMLAAHRHGGRVTMLAFARSWDGFTRAKRVRRATPRELRTLEHLLLASLRDESGFAQAIAEYQASRPEIRVRRLGGRSKHSDTPPAAHPRHLEPPTLLTWQSHASRARAARSTGGCTTLGAPTMLRQTP